jgi:hypothetical protein
MDIFGKGEKYANLTWHHLIITNTTAAANCGDGDTVLK